MAEYSKLFDQLIRDGYCIVPGVASDSDLAPVRVDTDRTIAGLSKEHLEQNKSTGTLVHSDDTPYLASLIGHPKAYRALDGMGIPDYRFWKANVISKPPGGPRLYWHQDCIMWGDPRAYSDRPPMIFLMYYLTDTSRHNGCLRVIPGTHRKRHPLHEIGTAHDKASNSLENPDDPRYGDFDGEIDVPVKAGDLVVGDARLFHAAHQNSSDKWRTVITIWFHPWFSDLLPETQSWIHRDMHLRHDAWPAEALEKIERVIPRYSGDAEPMEFNRFPSARLK